MPQQVTKLRLFVASPRDVKTERDLLVQVVHELNRTIAGEKRLVLEVVRWETHTHPDMGLDPQDVVNRQIGPADIFVGILWNRIGTPTKRALSGTVEEFERARDLWRQGRLRHILIYFKTAGFRPQTEEESEQIRKVAAFRKSVEDSALVKDFKAARSFQDLVRSDLANLILSWDRSATDGFDWAHLQTIYLETFDMAVRTEDGWTGIHSVWSTAVKDDPIWKYVLQGGVFSMENRSVPDAAHYIHLGITSIDTADLPVSVEVRIDTSPDAHLAGGGLVYRFDSRHQEYLAYIILSGQRLALFCRTQKMGYEAIYSGRCNLIREGDFNKLGMVGVGSHIHLYVGDQLLRKVHCREKLSNEVGIISCGKGRFEFDNFGIYDTALG